MEWSGVNSKHGMYYLRNTPCTCEVKLNLSVCFRLLVRAKSNENTYIYYECYHMLRNWRLKTK